MDERTVLRVLQAAVAAMEGKWSWAREFSGTGETCRCVLQAEAPEGSAHQSAQAIIQEKQDELVRTLKRNVRSSDRIVPRWCGQIELVLRNTNEDCAERVVHRLRTQLGASNARVSLDASFCITIVAGEGVEVTQPRMRKESGEFALKNEERS
jgi:hypothetical protein